MPEVFGPGLAGWYAADQARLARERAGLQQTTGLMAMQDQIRKAQQQQQMQSEIASAQSPEQQSQIAMKYGGAPAILSHLDRQSALTVAQKNREMQIAQHAHDVQVRGEQEIAKVREQAAQNRITKEEADRREAIMRADMIRLTAALRPGPADKVPMGYRTTADGNLEPIPGGPADTKLQGVLNQDTANLNESLNSMDRLAQEANALKEHPGLSKATGKMSWVPGVGGLATIPGTDSANFQARLDTLKSQVAFGVLQNMRNNSKTGGALGQISNIEEKMLMENLAGLSRAQRPEEFKDALGRILDYTEGAKDRLRAAYNMRHGDKSKTTAPTASSIPPGIDPKVWGVMTPEEQKLFQ